jgi:probable HAF family extracellular repeat protein
VTPRQTASWFLVTIGTLLGAARTEGSGIVGTGVSTGAGGSRIFALSSDGNVAVGYSAFDNHSFVARWTEAGGMQDLGSLYEGSTAVARAVNADGSVIFGESSFLGSSDPRPFRWTPTSGMQYLGMLSGGPECHLRGASGDGSFAVGYAGARAVAWTQAEGIHYIDLPPSWSTMFAGAVSLDGSVIAGDGGTFQVTHAFRWTAAGGFRDLGVLPGGTFSHACALSGDGAVVAGNADGPAGDRPFRWTDSSGMEDLGPGPVGWSELVVLGLSGNGSVAAGVGVTAGGGKAFLWRRDVGIVDLRGFLAQQGVDVSAWPQLFEVWGVSADGRRIAGWGRHLMPGGARSEGFVAHIDGCGSADFNHDGNTATDADIEAFFACFAGSCCPLCGSADFNGDGNVATDADIESFFRVLGGGSC